MKATSLIFENRLLQMQHSLLVGGVDRGVLVALPEACCLSEITNHTSHSVCGGLV